MSVNIRVSDLHVTGWLLYFALVSLLIFKTCAHANVSQHSAHGHVRPLNTKHQHIALFFNCLFKSLSTAKFGQLCTLTSTVISCVFGYKDSLVKSVCVGSVFLGNDFFLIQKAVCKWVAKRSIAICVVKFLTFLDKCPARGIFKIYATFNITRAKKALFFSAFLSEATSCLSFHFSPFFPGSSLFCHQKWSLFYPFM